MNHTTRITHEAKVQALLFSMSLTLIFFCFAEIAGTKDASAVFTGLNFIDMEDSCVMATEEQIKMEITASLKYLNMGAFFSRDKINRPGLAKFFFDAASEEREHAYKLIEYLSMRGRYLGGKNGAEYKSTIPNFDISQLVRDSENLRVNDLTLVDLAATNEKTTSGLIALQNALKLETLVTKSIRNLVKVCEGSDFNHYHVSISNNDSYD